MRKIIIISLSLLFSATVLSMDQSSMLAKIAIREISGYDKKGEEAGKRVLQLIKTHAKENDIQVLIAEIMKQDSDEVAWTCCLF